MALEISPDVDERLTKTSIIWLTSVREDGTPQPTPVWFLWYDHAILIFSQPGAHKVRNIAHNARVALNLNTDEWGGSVLVVSGEARVETTPIPAAQMAAYLDKYREAIKNLGMTPEGMFQSYSTAIRVRPTRIRSEASG